MGRKKKKPSAATKLVQSPSTLFSAPQRITNRDFHTQFYPHLHSITMALYVSNLITVPYYDWQLFLFNNKLHTSIQLSKADDVKLVLASLNDLKLKGIKVSQQQDKLAFEFDYFFLKFAREFKAIAKTIKTKLMFKIANPIIGAAIAYVAISKHTPPSILTPSFIGYIGQCYLLLLAGEQKYPLIPLELIDSFQVTVDHFPAKTLTEDEKNRLQEIATKLRYNPDNNLSLRQEYSKKIAAIMFDPLILPKNIHLIRVAEQQSIDSVISNFLPVYHWYFNAGYFLSLASAFLSNNDIDAMDKKFVTVIEADQTLSIQTDSPLNNQEKAIALFESIIPIISDSCRKLFELEKIYLKSDFLTEAELTKLRSVYRIVNNKIPGFSHSLYETYWPLLKNITVELLAANLQLIKDEWEIFLLGKGTRLLAIIQFNDAKEAEQLHSHLSLIAYTITPLIYINGFLGIEFDLKNDLTHQINAIISVIHDCYSCPFHSPIIRDTLGLAISKLDFYDTKEFFPTTITYFSDSFCHALTAAPSFPIMTPFVFTNIYNQLNSPLSASNIETNEYIKSIIIKYPAPKEYANSLANRIFKQYTAQETMALSIFENCKYTDLVGECYNKTFYQIYMATGQLFVIAHAILKNQTLSEALKPFEDLKSFETIQQDSYSLRSNEDSPLQKEYFNLIGIITSTISSAYKELIFYEQFFTAHVNRPNNLSQKFCSINYPTKKMTWLKIKDQNTICVRGPQTKIDSITKRLEEHSIRYQKIYHFKNPLLVVNNYTSSEKLMQALPELSTDSPISILKR